MVPVKPEDCTLDYARYESLLSNKTRLVAFTVASNVCGSLTDAKRIVKAAKSAGAITYADAVHYTPHFVPDVQVLGCDFMACSPYKFCGPHMGMLYGRRELLLRLKPYKVEPASSDPPECWETGTKSFEALAGFNAAIEYLSSLGEGPDLRDRLESSYESIAAYEREWSGRFLEKAASVKGLKVWGITDKARLHERTATFALTFDKHTPQEVSDYLARNHITTGASHFYGQGVIEALGLTKTNIMRVGCVHYNIFTEMDRLFEVMSGFKKL